MSIELPRARWMWTTLATTALFALGCSSAGENAPGTAGEAGASAAGSGGVAGAGSVSGASGFPSSAGAAGVAGSGSAAGASAGGAAGAAGAAGTTGSGGTSGAGAGSGSGGSAGTQPNFGPVEELRTGVNLPNAIATDAKYVYWTEDGHFSPNYQGDGRVVRRAKSGGAIQVLAKGRDRPSDLFVDSTRVYWSDSGDYWDLSNPGRVASVPKAGGTVKELASDTVVYGMVEDPTTLYFRSDMAVKRVPKAGGKVIKLAGGLDSPSGLATDGSTVFFTTSTQNGLPVSQSLGTVQSVATTGGALTLLAEAKSAHSVAVDDKYAYFASKGSLMRIAKGGGAPTELAKSSSVGHIAVSDGWVYWTDCSGGTVLALPRSGGTAKTLAFGYTCPSWLSIEAHYVYFTDYGDINGTISNDHAGVIARVPK
ncbi:MAG: hypothetical protein R3B13_03330 [Polyangiaceae bacterium]